LHKSDTLHGRSICNDEHVKVSLDIVVEPNVLLHIPNVDDDTMTIETIDTFSLSNQSSTC